jgi:hypothetical protein
MYSFGWYRTAAAPTDYLYDVSLVLYDLNTDPSLNNPTILTSNVRNPSPSTMNTSLPFPVFDSNNNVYYILANGLYKASIDQSTFNFNIGAKIQDLSASQYSGMTYNNYNNSLYFIQSGRNPDINSNFIYDLTNSTFKTDISGSKNLASFDSLNNVYYLPFNGSLANPVTLKVLYRIVCFKEDSKILTSSGYKLIQELKAGDLVKTSQNGYKPIYKIGYAEMTHPCSEERIKDQLYKCSSSNYPELFEDLVITGCHNILVDSFKDEKEREEAKKINSVKDEDVYITENKYRLPACVDERTTVYEVKGDHKIYHFALENEDNYMNYGVYANGLLVETTSKRFMDERVTIKYFINCKIFNIIKGFENFTKFKYFTFNKIFESIIDLK